MYQLKYVEKGKYIAAGLASQLLELKVVVQALSKLMMNRQQIRLEFEKMPEMRRAPTEKGFCKKENPAPAFFHLVPVHSSVYIMVIQLEEKD